MAECRAGRRNGRVHRFRGGRRRPVPRVGGFILLSDSYDPELAADFEGDGRFVLPKPVQEAELERVLKLVEPKAPRVIPISKTGTA